MERGNSRFEVLYFKKEIFSMNKFMNIAVTIKAGRDIISWGRTGV